MAAASVTPRRSRCGHRHVLALLAAGGVAVAFAQRVGVGVAIVAMVNATAVRDAAPAHNVSLVCPLAILPPNASSAASARRSGSLVWSRREQGLVLSAFYWGYIPLQIPGGSLAQRFGAKWVLAGGVVGASLLSFLSPAAASLGPAMFAASRAAQGLAQALIFPALAAMLGRWAPPGEEALLAVLATSGVTVGSIAGQAAAGPLCDSAWGWPAVFYATGAAGLLWLGPWAAIASNSPERDRCVGAAERLLIAAGRGRNTQQRMNRRSGVPWLKIMTDRAVWGFLGSSFCSMWIFFTLLTCLPQFLSDVLKLGVEKDGFVASLPLIISLPVHIGVAAVTDCIVQRCPASKTRVRKVSILIMFTTSGAALVGVSFVDCNAPAAVALLVTAMVGLSFAAGVMIPNPLDLSPEFAGSITAVGSIASSVSGAVSPFLTDELVANGTVREWNWVFYSGAIAAAIGMILFLLLGSGEKRPWSYLPESEEETEEDEKKEEEREEEDGTLIQS